LRPPHQKGGGGKKKKFKKKEEGGGGGAEDRKLHNFPGFLPPASTRNTEKEEKKSLEKPHLLAFSPERDGEERRGGEGRERTTPGEKGGKGRVVPFSLFFLPKKKGGKKMENPDQPGR